MQNEDGRLDGGVTDTSPTTTVTHRYNLLGQRIATDVAADGKPAAPLARYHYNADGSLAETALGPDGLPRKYRYDPLGELTQIADPAMTETLGYKLPGDQGYGDGNVTQAAYDLHYTDGVSYTYAYSYDPHDRLTAAHNDQAKLAGSSLEAVTYDPNGNVKTERRGDGQTHTYTLAPKTNQVVTVSGDGTNAHYAYDAKGRLNGASGEGAPDVSSLDYDPLNNLPRHVSAGDAAEVDYHYDVHNRRVAKVSRNGGADTSRIYYRGQGATALTELAGDATAPEPQTYLRGPGGLQAVTLQGQRYYVSRDHLGSTRALMDATGKVAAYFNYTPFGQLMPGNSQDSDGLAADMAYRFAGTEYDTETGLYNNRARWYDPILGRFLTPDPDHQYPSPYVYVGNNPVNGVDPTGMWEWNENPFYEPPLPREAGSDAEVRGQEENWHDNPAYEPPDLSATLADVDRDVDAYYWRIESAYYDRIRGIPQRDSDSSEVEIVDSIPSSLRWREPSRQGQGSDQSYLQGSDTPPAFEPFGNRVLHLLAHLVDKHMPVQRGGTWGMEWCRVERSVTMYGDGSLDANEFTNAVREMYMAKGHLALDFVGDRMRFLRIAAHIDYDQFLLNIKSLYLEGEGNNAEEFDTFFEGLRQTPEFKVAVVVLDNLKRSYLKHRADFLVFQLLRLLRIMRY